MSLSMEPGDFFLLGKVVAKDGEENLNQQSLDPTTFLLCGPDWRMSVTLLMQLACTMKKQDDTCWIITTRHMMDTYHPLEVSVAQYKGSHADDASALGSSSNMPHIWSRVCIKYVDSLYDVLKIASVLPLATKPPIMVLLHGLDAMIDASNKIIPALVSASSKGGQSHGRLVSVESLLCRTLATLTDAMETIASKTNRGGDVVLGGTVISSKLEEPPRVFYLLKRWFHRLFGYFPSVDGQGEVYRLSEIGLHPVRGPVIIGCNVIFAVRDASLRVIQVC